MIETIDIIGLVSTALIHSIWQIALISCAVWVALKLVPKRFQKLRSIIPIFGLSIIPIWFFVTLLDTVLQSGNAELGLQISTTTYLGSSLIVIWVGSAICGLWELASNWRGLQRLKHSSYVTPSDELTTMLNSLLTAMCISRSVELRLSRYVSTACTIGALKPIVFLPFSCLTGLSKDQIIAVLAHELAHVKRLDFVWAWLRSLIKIVFYYHPGTHLLIRQIERETEFACDRLVLQVGSSPSVLAAALLRLSLSRPNGLILSASASPTADIEERIERLTGLQTHKSKSTQTTRYIPIIAAAFAVMMSYGAMKKIPSNEVHHADQSSINFELTRYELVSLKDAICAQISADNIYWNPTYDQGGPAQVTFAANTVSMNDVPLPDKTQAALRPIFEQFDTSRFKTVSIRYYGDDVKLRLSHTEGRKNDQTLLYSLAPGSSHVTRVSLSDHDKA